MGNEIIQAVAEARGEVALVTIIEIRGSVPRHPGSKMLVRPTGSILGSVGGGKGEALAIQAAQRCIQERRSDTLTVEMMGAEAEGQTPVCGGTNRMLVERVVDAEPYRQAHRLLQAGLRSLMLRRIPGRESAAVALLDEKGVRVCGAEIPFDAAAAARCVRTGKPLFTEEEGLFYDPLLPEERLLVLGAGHVGLAVASLAVGLDFRVTVVDEREELLAPGRFPPAVATLCRGYREAVEDFPFDASTYVMIVTHGHLHDLECIRAVLTKTYRYAGCIGSVRKTRLLLEQAKNDGYDEKKVEALYAPIGLDIGAETPAEIAVSIMGEMIAVRHNTDTPSGMSRIRRAQ